MGANLSFPDVDIPSDKTYIVTGANTGIGYEIAKQIAIMGGHVIIACRNMGKAEAAMKQMQEEYETDLRKKQKTEPKVKQGEPKKLSIEQMELDLASFNSTMKFIEEFKAKNYNLNVLVCNAGIVVPEKQLTEDGNELMLQANYLSHLLIILHFLPILLKSGEDSRIVQTSSSAHRNAKFDLENMNAEKKFVSLLLATYGNTKLYQLMSMSWLARHLKDKSVTISACIPGLVKTQMTQGIAFLKLLGPVSRSPLQGAATIIKAATDPSLKDHTDIYMDDCKIIQSSEVSRNIEKQDGLMKFSFDTLNKYLPSDIEDYIDV